MILIFSWKLIWSWVRESWTGRCPPSSNIPLVRVGPWPGGRRVRQTTTFWSFQTEKEDLDIGHLFKAAQRWPSSHCNFDWMPWHKSIQCLRSTGTLGFHRLFPQLSIAFPEMSSEAPPKSAQKWSGPERCWCKNQFRLRWRTWFFDGPAEVFSAAFIHFEYN